MATTIEVPRPSAEAETFAEHKLLREAARKAPPTESASPAAEEPTEHSELKSESAEVTEPAEKKNQEQPRKLKQSAEERIKELNAEKKREKERADKLEQELQTLRTRKPDPSPTPEAKTEPKTEDDPKPRLAEFTADAKSYEDAQEKYLEAVDAWKDRQNKKVAEQRTAQDSEAKSRQAVQERLAKVREKHSDFNEVAGNVGIGLDARGMHLFLSGSDFDHPLEILYQLGKNPAEHQRILALPMVKRLAALSAIDDSITAPPENKTQPVSKVPPPPARVGGTNPPEPKNARDARTREEYKRLRSAQRGS
jgi:hypothetical protein